MPRDPPGLLEERRTIVGFSRPGAPGDGRVSGSDPGQAADHDLTIGLKQEGDATPSRDAEASCDVLGEMHLEGSANGAGGKKRARVDGHRRDETGATKVTFVTASEFGHLLVSPRAACALVRYFRIPISVSFSGRYVSVTKSNPYLASACCSDFLFNSNWRLISPFQ